MIQFDSQDKTMLTRLANRNMAPPMTQFSQRKENHYGKTLTQEQEIAARAKKHLFLEKMFSH